MRYNLTIMMCAFLSSAIALEKELPFSESAKTLLNIETLSIQDIERLNAFVFSMDNRKNSYKKKKNFISYLYDNAHKDVLLSYEQLTSFEELVSLGKYNCLTGSTFFALLYGYTDHDP